MERGGLYSPRSEIEDWKTIKAPMWPRSWGDKDKALQRRGLCVHANDLLRSWSERGVVILRRKHVAAFLSPLKYLPSRPACTLQKHRQCDTVIRDDNGSEEIEPSAQLREN